MQYRQLGASGLRVSTLALGTMGFGATGWATVVGNIDIDDARRQIGMARDAGVNLVDTADMYSSGASEEVLGHALGDARKDMLIATKVRLPMGEGPNDAGLSRYHVIRSVEASLRRLHTDHIDLYQAHGWDGHTPLEETLGAFDDLVRSGKVRYIGVSNYTGWQLMKACRLAGERRLAPIVSQQIYYSVHDRDAEVDLLPAACDQGVGTLIWSPLAGGLLTGKYRRDHETPAGSRFLGDWDQPPVKDQERFYDIVEVLVEVAQRHGRPPAQIALAYAIAKPAVTSLIVGARSTQQLEQTLAATDVQLSADDLAALDAVSAYHLPYPHWHQAMHNTDRLSPADLTLLEGHIGE
ncbi:aldo/keto reductase [Mycolicibacterium sp. YH-1]|uniref:aldo/keto reductase n=1 Tax=Mycolicibacterium sp. YH-1 TaxID=2908837 RepID=UPI001F4BFC2D|nr:aldo/keto reductase [Mycolicibacterium sp. YH-1]UNB52939.1 aldo/keto reductase [Mycolicibacterium sp. YH-1]